MGTINKVFKEIKINKNIMNLFILFSFVILIIFRLPEIWKTGRFLCEEGAVFFAYAWHFPGFSSLWRPFAGYLNLGANASTFLDASLVKSGIVTLEKAPYVTTIIALFFQMQAAIIILWGKADWLNDTYTKIKLLLVIALCPFCEEVWLNVMHIQYQLMLCCGLLLAIDTPKKYLGWIYQSIILFLAPLCGLGAIVLTPLFLLRTIIDRSVSRLCQTIILSLGGLLQLCLFYSSSVVRGQVLTPSEIFSVLFVRMGVYPFFGNKLGKKIGEFIYHGYINNGLTYYIIPVLYAFLIIYLLYKFRKTVVFWFILVSFLIAVVSFGGGVIAMEPSAWFHVKYSERYNFIPFVFLGMSIVLMAYYSKGNYKIVFNCGFILMMLVGISSYIKPVQIISSGPDWSQQVKLWRQNPQYQLRIWGWTWDPDWNMDLTDVNRTCPPVSRANASYSDPTYCETSWIAHVLSLPKTK